MTHEQTVLIGIGSNTGDKVNHLQSAIDAIHTQIGSIDQISSLYQTPALGFEGADFINGCLKVSTQLEASQVLDKLLAIKIIPIAKKDAKTPPTTTSLAFCFP